MVKGKEAKQILKKHPPTKKKDGVVKSPENPWAKCPPCTCGTCLQTTHQIDRRSLMDDKQFLRWINFCICLKKGKKATSWGGSAESAGDDGFF